MNGLKVTKLGNIGQHTHLKVYFNYFCHYLSAQSSMPRYFMVLAYNGTRFHGWQYQPNANTVQELLETQLSKLLEPGLKITGAGRTDAGVHASSFTTHFDSEKSAFIESGQLMHTLNRMLPPDVSIYAIQRVRPDAHARFDALSRTYQYHILRKKDPFRTETTWLYTAPLNPEIMQQGAERLLHYNDFRSFCKVHTDVRTFICRIEEASWEFRPEEWIFTIKADRFLRNMVRAIVGTLWEMGRGKLSISDLDAILEAGNRSAAGLSVPASGLILTAIDYPSHLYPVSGRA